MIVVYTLVFSKTCRQGWKVLREPMRTAFTFARASYFGGFSEISLRTGCFLGASAPHKKINFPRLCLPAIVVGSGLINFSIILSIFGRVSSHRRIARGRVNSPLAGACCHRLVRHFPRCHPWYSQCIFSGCRAFFFSGFAVLVLAYTDCLSRIDPSGLGASASGF